MPDRLERLAEAMSNAHWETDNPKLALALQLGKGALLLGLGAVAAASWILASRK